MPRQPRRGIAAVLWRQRVLFVEPEVVALVLPEVPELLEVPAEPVDDGVLDVEPDDDPIPEDDPDEVEPLELGVLELPLEDG